MPDFPQTISKGKHHVSIYAPTLSKARYRINYWIDGKRYQRNFVAYEEAKTQATRILNQLARNNRPGAALNLRDSEIYLRLKLATESRGFSIQEAIDNWTTAVDLLPNPKDLVSAAGKFSDQSTTIQCVTAQIAVEEYLQFKKPQLRERTFEQEAQRLRRFSKAFVCSIPELSRDSLRTWIDSLRVRNSMKRLTAKTKNHFRASIRTFLNWCVDKDYLEENHRLNAALKGERIQNTKPIEIYTPDEFGSILKASTGTIRILIAIAGFAGLRTAELLRLHREDILPEHIQVGKEKAKTRQRRLIPICNSLKLILQNSEHSAGPIWPTTKSTFYRDLEIIFAKAKVKQKANAFRHSFCSYRLAHTSDENLTAREAGTSPAMIYRHYGEVVTEKKGLQWFSQKT